MPFPVILQDTYMAEILDTTTIAHFSYISQFNKIFYKATVIFYIPINIVSGSATAFPISFFINMAPYMGLI